MDTSPESAGPLSPGSPPGSLAALAHEERRLAVVPRAEEAPVKDSPLEALVVGTDLALLAPLVSRLRSKGIRPMLTMAPDQAVRLTEQWSPHAAVLVDECGSPARLLRHLERRVISTVLVAAPESLAAYAGVGTIAVCLLPPVDADELARAVEIAALANHAPASSGSFSFDVRSCLVSVDGNDVHLPPKELAVMAELARHPGEPVPSEQLVSHIYSECPATPEDIHRLVYRLRQLIGDHDRVPPLIVNRRGFGYALDLGTRVVLDGDPRDRTSASWSS